MAAGLGFASHKTSSTAVTTQSAKDYVETGLPVSTNETSSTLATSTSDNQTQTSESSPRNRTQSTETTLPTTTTFIDRPSGNIPITINNNNATSTSDCWQSWLNYWSASSLNQVTYTTSTYAPRTVTKVELQDEISLIPTSSWESFVDTATYSDLITYYSDGYPVSVSVSYRTQTYSNVGWDEFTIWSHLREHLTTFTETWSWYDDITTTQSTTALPTPRCKLPAVASGCSAQWSSYINVPGWKYYNDYDDPSSGYFPGTPDCTQAQITGDWCTTMASFYFARETMYGQDKDVGWITEGSTSYFPASKSLAPGCSLGCQACSITGESVQLLYWPPSTATLVENGTETATLTPFVHNVSAVRTALFDGE